MKKVFVTLTFLIGLNAFADVSLVPGTSTVIQAGEATTVNCRAADLSLPECSLRAIAAGGVKTVYSGEIPMFNGDLDQSLEVMEKLKRAGVCR